MKHSATGLKNLVEEYKKFLDHLEASENKNSYFLPGSGTYDLVIDREKANNLFKIYNL